jgi:hypothetical protein
MPKLIPHLPEPEAIKPRTSYRARLSNPGLVDNPTSIHFYLARCEEQT